MARAAVPGAERPALLLARVTRDEQLGELLRALRKTLLHLHSRALVCIARIQAAQAQAVGPLPAALARRSQPCLLQARHVARADTATRSVARRRRDLQPVLCAVLRRGSEVAGKGRETWEIESEGTRKTRARGGGGGTLYACSNGKNVLV